jgi:alpha-tubulin suppressor-like RCC1 family protein
LGLAGNTATSIGAGLYHTCALRSDDKVVCWGFNGNGQLGRVGAATTGQTAGSMADNLVAVDIGAGNLNFPLNAISLISSVY